MAQSIMLPAIFPRRRLWRFLPGRRSGRENRAPRARGSVQGAALVFGASAGAAIYRRSMLEDIGLFDEGFFMVYKDSDLNFRAQLMGFKCLYVPTAMGTTFWGLRSAGTVLATNGMPFAAYARRGQVKPFSRAKTHALARMPAMLAKRGEIQKSRRVSDKEIEDSLMKGWLGNKVRTNTRQALSRSGLSHETPARPTQT